MVIRDSADVPVGCKISNLIISKIKMPADGSAGLGVT